MEGQERGKDVESGRRKRFMEGNSGRQGESEATHSWDQREVTLAPTVEEGVWRGTRGEMEGQMGWSRLGEAKAVCDCAAFLVSENIYRFHYAFQKMPSLPVFSTDFLASVSWARACVLIRHEKRVWN